MRRLMFFFLCLIAAAVLNAQGAEGAKIRIESVEYNIEGRTKEFALAGYAQIIAGTEFENISEFKNYIEQKIRHLRNNRIFEDVNIEYTLEENADGITAAHLNVSTADTRNFLIVPYPKYDSNTGFLFRLRAWDKNSFGAMNLLQADLGYSYTRENPAEDAKNGLLLNIETIIPFNALGFVWNIDIYTKNTWIFGSDYPFVSNSAAGISVDIPLRRAVFTPGFRERAVITAKNELTETDFEDAIFASDTRIYKPKYQNTAHIVLDEWYMSSRPYIKLTLPAGIRLLDAEFVYETLAAGEIAYTAGGISPANEGLNIELNHRFGFFGVNWLGNFRDGYYAYIQNDNIYNAAHNDVSSYISLTAGAHKKFTTFFGMSARLIYKQWFASNDDWTLQSAAEAGRVVRGVPDRALLAKGALSLNLDFPFRVFVFMPSQWFNTRKLRYFDFELHFSPMLDIAFVDGVQYNEKFIPVRYSHFNFDDIYIGAGFSFLVFPLTWRSLFLRLSAAVNVRDAVKERSLFAGSGAEIFFGIGHYF
ncbi:MAG: hypothetical protein LBG72_05540 [Spirochaetaceae bacterium]|jgi:hypothetical protein|nr:hypothetical protein [Spirochaetaceae bacterium]